MPQTLEPLLRSHRFFAGLPEEYLAVVTGCAVTAVYPAGAFLFREGDPSRAFYLIRAGRVALEIAGPERGALVVQTLGEGDVAGFSWLIEPHRWTFDGRAMERVVAIQLDGECLRGKCDADPRLGYELMRRFSALAVSRLHAARLQLLDMYGHARAR